MTVIEMMTKELEKEAVTTRKMLQCIPEGQFDFKPHEKSMDIQALANHLAELPYWVGMTLHTDELDFASNPYQPTAFRNTRELVDFFDKGVADAKENLSKANDELLPRLWTLRSGDQIYEVSTKGDTLRMSYCQTVHHRAQLGVYLRLLNIPIPGSYGPSADDVTF